MTNSIDQSKMMPGESLLRLGWDAFWETQLRKGDRSRCALARVTGTRKNSFVVSDGEMERRVTVSGSLIYRILDLYPVVGDWVLLKDAVITEVLPRKNAISRGAAGARGKQDETAREAQVIAANIDTVLIVCGMDRDFNVRRLERYLTLVYNCGIDPAIVLTKADLHEDPGPFEAELGGVAFGIPVHRVSALESIGLSAIEAYLSPGRTVAMIGSSGAGKSTLLNRLFGKGIQAVGAVSDGDGKGMHTTTTRDLIRMPQGGMLIDNPGIREIAFWDDEGGIDAVFPEIEALAGSCRFSDCSHLHEPGCRVLQALREGELDRGRLESYRKMKRELMYLSEREHKTAGRVEKERWKKIASAVKAMKKRD